jgi:polyferredoxin
MSAVYGVAVTFLNGFFKGEYKNDAEVREKLKKVKRTFTKMAYFYLINIVVGILLFFSLYLMIHTALPFSASLFSNSVLVGGASFFVTLYYTIWFLFEVSTLLEIDIILNEFK